MRIAFFTPNLHALLVGPGIFGGAEKQVVVLARALRELGHEPCFVSADAGLPARASTALGPLHRAGPLASTAARVLPKAATRLFSALLGTRADACYVRVANPYLVAIAAWARLVGARAIFAAAHDTDCVTRGGTPWLTPMQRRLYLAGLAGVHGVLAQHEGQARAFRRELGVASTVVPNAVVVPRGLADASATAVVSMTRPDPLKRADRFVALARSLPARQFVLIGTPDPLALAGGTPPNLHLTGPLPAADAETWLERAALVVGTSTSEGFPNVYLEAWARGVPVVSVEVDPDGVIGAEGLGVVCAREGDLTAEVERLLEDGLARRAIGARARAYVVAHHAPDRVARAVEAALRGVDGSTPAP